MMYATSAKPEYGDDEERDERSCELILVSLMFLIDWTALAVPFSLH